MFDTMDAVQSQRVLRAVPLPIHIYAYLRRKYAETFTDSRRHRWLTQYRHNCSEILASLYGGSRSLARCRSYRSLSNI